MDGAKRPLCSPSETGSESGRTSYLGMYTLLYEGFAFLQELPRQYYYSGCAVTDLCSKSSFIPLCWRKTHRPRAIGKHSFLSAHLRILRHGDVC